MMMEQEPGDTKTLHHGNFRTIDKSKWSSSIIYSPPWGNQQLPWNEVLKTTWDEPYDNESTNEIRTRKA